MLLAAPAVAALPAVDVEVTTVPLANNGAHRGVTVTATCPGTARLVGGGSYLRNQSDPAVIPTNGLVLGATVMSTGAAPVDLAVADGALDPASWMSIANYTGVSEDGNQASTFALCATSEGPAHTVVKTASYTGVVGTQEVNPPNAATATCPAGTRLIGGGAQTRTPDQVDDGTTVGNNGNLKPLGNHPSDENGIPAADGARDATSWTAYGSAGITTPQDTATAFALCSGDPGTPPVQVERVDVDGPDAQPGTTPIIATASCSEGTRLLGGGYRIDESVAGVGSGLQPQQGYHMRGSYPSTPGVPPAPPLALADGAADPSSWTSLVSAGGQNLGAGKHMTNHAYALCATEPPPPESADLSLAMAADPDPVTVDATLTYTLTITNHGPSQATGVATTQTLPAGVTFVSADPRCTHATGTVSCALGGLAVSGAASSTTVAVTVIAREATLLQSDASVTSAVADPNADNNAAAVATSAQQPERQTTSLSGRPVPATAALGAAIADEVTLSGGAASTGAITFALYGPGDSGCANPIATSTALVDGPGVYRSQPHTTTATRDYRWIASYGGDGANEPAATACADAGQAVSVKAAPRLALRALPGGAAIAASATVTDGTIVTGTLTFRVYGPGDDGCATALASSASAVSGNGIYAGAPFVPNGPGVYRWTVEYDGNADNFPAGPTSCADPAAAVTVASTPPSPTPPPPPSPSPPPSAPPPPSVPAPPSNAFTLASVRTASTGRITVRLRSPGRGQLRAIATVRRGRVEYRLGVRTIAVRTRGALAFSIAPGLRARRELRRRDLRVSVAVWFQPTGGTQRTRTTYVTVKRPRTEAKTRAKARAGAR